MRSVSTSRLGLGALAIGVLIGLMPSVGPMAGKTVVPTGITLFGPVGQICNDNCGNSGTQVLSQSQTAP